MKFFITLICKGCCAHGDTIYEYHYTSVNGTECEDRTFDNNTIVLLASVILNLCWATLCIRKVRVVLDFNFVHTFSTFNIRKQSKIFVLQE